MVIILAWVKQRLSNRKAFIFSVYNAVDSRKLNKYFGESALESKLSSRYNFISFHYIKSLELTKFCTNLLKSF